MAGQGEAPAGFQGRSWTIFPEAVPGEPGELVEAGHRDFSQRWRNQLFSPRGPASGGELPKSGPCSVPHHERTVPSFDPGGQLRTQDAQACPSTPLGFEGGQWETQEPR